MLERVFSLEVRQTAHSDKLCVPTLPVPSADIGKNVHLTVHLKIKSYQHSEFWGHSWYNPGSHGLKQHNLYCPSDLSWKMTRKIFHDHGKCSCMNLLRFILEIFRDVEFTILIQRSYVFLCWIWNSVTIVCLIVLTNCKIICSDYFLDYIAVSLKFL